MIYFAVRFLPMALKVFIILFFDMGLFTPSLINIYIVGSRVFDFERRKYFVCGLRLEWVPWCGTIYLTITNVLMTLISRLDFVYFIMVLYG